MTRDTHTLKTVQYGSPEYLVRMALVDAGTLLVVSDCELDRLLGWTEK